MSEGLNLPWKPRSPQMEGMSSEAREAKKRGARPHPRSGAGSIKWDASSEDTLYEMKRVKKSHALNGEYLRSLALSAARQGKQAVYVVTMTDADIEIECTINLKGKSS